MFLNVNQVKRADAIAWIPIVISLDVVITFGRQIIKNKPAIGISRSDLLMEIGRIIIEMQLSSMDCPSLGSGHLTGDALV